MAATRGAGTAAGWAGMSGCTSILRSHDRHLVCHNCAQIRDRIDNGQAVSTYSESVTANVMVVSGWLSDHHGEESRGRWEVSVRAEEAPAKEHVASVREVVQAMAVMTACAPSEPPRRDGTARQRRATPSDRLAKRVRARPCSV